jgi:hypothetical protein
MRVGMALVTSSKMAMSMLAFTINPANWLRACAEKYVARSSLIRHGVPRVMEYPARSPGSTT